MKLTRILLLALCMLFTTLGLGATASAQQNQQDDLFENADGRLRGYEKGGYILEESSVALTYLALLALSAIALGVLFKSSSRTHLD